MIAEELRLSVKTISTYRARILQKLSCESTGELIRYAIEARLIGLVSTPPFSLAEGLSLACQPNADRRIHLLPIFLRASSAETISEKLPNDWRSERG